MNKCNIYIDDAWCTQGFLSEDIVVEHSRHITAHVSKDKEYRHILFPDLRLQCSGYITKWIVGGVLLTDQANTLNEAQLQLWRNNRTTECHTLIHRTVIRNLSDSSTNIFEISLQEPIAFSEGDFLGIYQEQEQDQDSGNSEFEVYYQVSNGPENLIPQFQIEPSDSYKDSELTAVAVDYPLVSVHISCERILYACIGDNELWVS